MREKTRKSMLKILRIDTQEWEVIKGKMNEMNLTFSELARNSMLGIEIKKKKKSKLQENKELILELKRWGNNLNQITRHLNQENNLDKIALLSLSRIEEALREIKQKHGC